MEFRITWPQMVLIVGSYLCWIAAAIFCVIFGLGAMGAIDFAMPLETAAMRAGLLIGGAVVTGLMLNVAGRVPQLPDPVFDKLFRKP